MRKRSSDPFFLVVVFSFFFFLPVEGFAQQVSFDAQVSETRVVQNGVFDIQFELSNADAENFRPPSFADFRVVGGPARGSSTTIINGAMTRSTSWSYSLLATKAGRFSIGPATVVVGGKTVSTRPISIEVVKGKDLAQRGAASGEQSGILVFAEVEKKDYYPGQQIILNYTILFTQNIQSVDIISEDDYADFFVQNLAEFSKQPTIETRNGIDYTSRIIKSIALYPHQSGEYQIDPLIMNVGVNAPFPGIQGFFTMRRMQDQRVATTPIKINVLPLPQDAPLTYQGAVGQYKLTTMAGKQDITTDEAVTFQLEIQGNGDAKRWDPPIAVTDSSFQVYDPKILEDRQAELQGMVDHHRMVEYQLLPRLPGIYSIYVPFTYFDPDAKRYVTIASDTLRVHVTQGILTARAAQEDEGLGKFEPMSLGVLVLPDRFWTSWLHLMLVGLLVSGSCWGLIVRARAKKEGKISATERVRSQAVRKALGALDALEKEGRAQGQRGFYEKATEIFNRFLCEHFSILPADLDETKLPVMLEKHHLSDMLRERIVELFRVCLPVRYGAVPAGYGPERMVEECREVVLACEGEKK